MPLIAGLDRPTHQGAGRLRVAAVSPPRMMHHRVMILRPTVSDLIAQSPDPGSIPIGFDEHLPDPSYFGFRVIIIISCDGHNSERFDCFVCSPKWLLDNFDIISRESKQPIFPWGSGSHSTMVTHGLVLMPTWIKDDLSHAIDQICNECSGPTWSVVAERLSRWFDWEYEHLLDEYLNNNSDRFVLRSDMES